MNILVRPPKIVRSLYNDAIWRKSKHEPRIYLTFDDGPIPDLTEWVLDVLKHYQIKATFFCVGENIVKHSQIFERIVNEGHRVGNHTFNHIKGWKTSVDEYLSNVEKCQALTQSDLFRPPYGRISKKQYQNILKTHQVILWDVLTYDYDKFTSPEKCLKQSIKHTRNGSIIVFHDNLKATLNLKHTLPKYIEACIENGFEFALL